MKHRRRRWLLKGVGFLFVLLLAIGLLWGSDFWGQRPSAPPAEPPLPQAEFPLPPVSSSPFRNTGPEARYVGSETCAACHKARTASFRRTGMGCSMAEVDPALEPADAVFDHPKSRRRYQVTRKEGQLWHRESLRKDGAEEVVLAEYPLKYVVGSGRHARTYLVEAEGFLMQSPLTWYAARQAWDMSPGYDRADHQSFERAINEMCLFCHAGQAAALGKSQHRVQIQEAAISCERCHGPGSLHVEHHTTHKGDADRREGIDTTIVNPNHLPRALAEAVCQQCHLHSAAMVLGRGRKVWGYRPGLPLQDFRQDYGLEVDSRPMTVVGHVEQLHLSRCYQESATLTCTTCHDPHALPRPEQRVAYYRAMCVSCHQPERCKVTKDRLLRESPENNCVQCHMPSSATEVPHVAFTHHRIAVHEKLPREQAKQAHLGAQAGVLRPLLGPVRLSDLDQNRSLGLAYLDVAREEKHPNLAGAYKRKAFEFLTAVHGAGLRDPALEASLAGLHFEQGQDKALPLAESVLSHPELSGSDRCAALFVVAAERVKRNQHKDALVALRELVTLRRHPYDWLLLGSCEQALGNPAAGVEALQRAVRINPHLKQVHQFLAQHYRQQGDAQRAAWHQQRAGP